MGVGSRVGRATREGAGSGDGAWPLSVFRQPAEVVLMSSAARLELETLNSETRRDADAIRARLQGEWSTSCFLSPPPTAAAGSEPSCILTVSQPCRSSSLRTRARPQCCSESTVTRCESAPSYPSSTLASPSSLPPSQSRSAPRPCSWPT